jgi:hypothetical protein
MGHFAWVVVGAVESDQTSVTLIGVGLRLRKAPTAERSRPARVNPVCPRHTLLRRGYGGQTRNTRTRPPRITRTGRSDISHLPKQGSHRTPVRYRRFRSRSPACESGEVMTNRGAVPIRFVHGTRGIHGKGEQPRTEEGCPRITRMRANPNHGGSRKGVTALLRRGSGYQAGGPGCAAQASPPQPLASRRGRAEAYRLRMPAASAKTATGPAVRGIQASAGTPLPASANPAGHLPPCTVVPARQLPLTPPSSFRRRRPARFRAS